MYDEDLDEDLDEDDEYVDERPRGYLAVLRNGAWRATRKLALEGTVFLHRKHAAEVHPGLQHKLLVWQCEARRPAAQCPCGLYALQWLDDEHKEGT